METTEFVRHVFGPEVTVPSQFFATVRRQAPSKTGEYRLLVALLDDAVERFKKYVVTGDRHLKEAEEWIMGSDESDGSASEPGGSTFSFPYVCSVLDFDADHLRRHLQRWRNAQVARRLRTECARRT
jgi:hypothetical protein